TGRGRGLHHHGDLAGRRGPVVVGRGDHDRVDAGLGAGARPGGARWTARLGTVALLVAARAPIDLAVSLGDVEAQAHTLPGVGLAVLASGGVAGAGARFAESAPLAQSVGEA